MKEGWKYEPLGSVGKFKRGGNFKKSDFVDDGMPCVHYGQIHMTFGTSTNQHLSTIPQSIYDKCTKGEKGDLLIAITSEDVEGSCKCTAWTGDYAVALGGHMARFRHNLNPLYVSYFFQSPTFQRAKKEYTHGFKVVEIKPSDIAKITIGYPSPEEQAVIVAKLDTAFARIDTIKHNAKVALEEAHSLFSSEINNCFSDEGLISQSEILQFEKCLVKVKRQPQIKAKYYLKEGKFPIVSQDASIISGYTNEQCMVYHHERPVIIFGDHTRVIKYIDFDFVVGADGTHILSTIERIEPKYFYYYLKSIKLKSLGYARHFKLLKENQIAVPPINIQKAIVNRLDTIECKVNKAISNFEMIEKFCSVLHDSVLKSFFE